MAVNPLPRELRRYRAWALAHAMPAGVRDPAFLDLVQRIEQTSFHAAPRIALFDNGARAFDAVLADMADARDEILLETYILRDDRIGVSVQQAMIAAAQRGVRVSVLADAIGSVATGAAFWKTLEEGGVVVRHFHRVLHMPFEALRRDHRKIIVIDRTIAFTGGMNIGEEYGSSIHSHGGAFRDSLLRLKGNVAGELAAVFAEGWDRAEGPPLPGLEYVSWSSGIVVPPLLSMHALGATAIADRVRRRVGLRRDKRRGRLVRRPSATPAENHRQLLVLDSRPGRGQREMMAILSALAGGARHRLWITTPYFAPPTRAVRLLRRVAERGVDVRLLLPGPLGDVAIARHAAHGVYATLLRSGVRIFEYQAATLHAKTLVVDSYASIVGSSNFDFRSFWLNAECNLLCFDDVCARALEHSFTHDLHVSTEITQTAWAQRSITHQLLDVAARSTRWAL